MLAEQRADEGFDLDYDTFLGETCRATVDPWTGKIVKEDGSAPESDSDADRTSRVKVNPWTGEIIFEGREAVDLESVELAEEPEPVTATEDTVDEDSKAFSLTLVAMITASALAAGAAVGTALTFWIFS